MANFYSPLITQRSGDHPLSNLQPDFTGGSTLDENLSSA